MQNADEVVHGGLERAHARPSVERRLHRAGIVEDDHHLERLGLHFRHRGGGDTLRLSSEDAHEGHRKIGRGFNHDAVNPLHFLELRRWHDRRRAKEAIRHVVEEIGRDLALSVVCEAEYPGACQGR